MGSCGRKGCIGDTQVCGRDAAEQVEEQDAQACVPEAETKDDGAQRARREPAMQPWFGAIRTRAGTMLMGTYDNMLQFADSHMKKIWLYCVLVRCSGGTGQMP